MRSGGTTVPAFVATTGGHLVQLQLLAPLLEPERFRSGLWITHRTAQSESMLAGEDVVFVPALHARDWMSNLRAMPRLLRTLREHGVDHVYSTGAALALATLPGARLVGARPTYVESLARSAEPSLTGRVLARVPWVSVHTQYPTNASRRWKYRYSLLESFTPAGQNPLPDTGLRVFVTVGTTRPWQFRRLLERILSIVPDNATVTWQTGVTETAGLGVDAVPMMSDKQFTHEIESADVVVSHAGCGSLIRTLQSGKVPILVPRRAAFGEHVDDHQEQIARVSSERGLALMREADELVLEDLFDAAARTVVLSPRLTAATTT